MREFSVEAQDTKNQQHKKNIRLDDPREKLLPRGKFKWRADRALQRQCNLRSLEAFDCPPIQLP